MMKFRNYLVIIFCLLYSTIISQNKPIYIFKSRYNSELNTIIENSDIDFREIKIMVNYMIDPKKKNEIDYQRVGEWIDKMFPSDDDTGVLCLDLENKYYDDIKGNYLTRYKTVDEEKYDFAINEFKNLVKFVKDKRPNVKVGVYGMPFKAYNNSELRMNEIQNLDVILENVDVLFPSFYIPYPAAKIPIEDNFDFLALNLNRSLEYGEKLNKPVIPFVWYQYHSPDKEYRAEMIPKNELFKYINYIVDYTLDTGNEVSGIIWWDTPSSYSSRKYKRTFVSEPDNIGLTIDEVFMYYFDLSYK